MKTCFLSDVFIKLRRNLINLRRNFTILRRNFTKLRRKFKNWSEGKEELVRIHETFLLYPYKFSLKSTPVR